MSRYQVYLTGLSLILIVAASLCAAQDKKAKETKKAEGVKLSEEEQKVLDLTNEERRKEGLPPLKVNEKLLKAARAYSGVMAKEGKATHDVDGTTPRKRATKAGYDGEYVAENVGYAFGGAAAKDMVKWWMGSKVHRENIVHKVLTEIGIGAVKDEKGQIFYTQLFGAPFKD